jgi:hypothetical protein
MTKDRSRPRRAIEGIRLSRVRRKLSPWIASAKSFTVATGKPLAHGKLQVVYAGFGQHKSQVDIAADQSNTRTITTMMTAHKRLPSTTPITTPLAGASGWSSSSCIGIDRTIVAPCRRGRRRAPRRSSASWRTVRDSFLGRAIQLAGNRRIILDALPYPNPAADKPGTHKIFETAQFI